ncbi:hypothetical protein PP175_06160 [Aneurinibacillus sp. Ricciae_BoGa-3]|uniref:hypothetical protein n=1 Tax=Aneurinibacillus sp. Ricciae_BoGa-3 TaxID=3022697 RepID=UPI00234112DB|nr:hypothetical protein [Aneurinibacillus sp. Ricciae_BoGa-3]WCK55530.1 hypothetical protein PP175_06160 [Aneurinibacillus sp. Ricciae_BoGa-3]
MRTLGSGEIVFYTMDGSVQRFEGEIQVADGRVILTEIIYFNGRPNGSREVNMPLARCVIYWKPEVYEEIGFAQA